MGFPLPFSPSPLLSLSRARPAPATGNGATQARTGRNTGPWWFKVASQLMRCIIHHILPSPVPYVLLGRTRAHCSTRLSASDAAFAASLESTCACPTALQLLHSRNCRSPLFCLYPAVLQSVHTLGHPGQLLRVSCDVSRATMRANCGQMVIILVAACTNDVPRRKRLGCIRLRCFAAVLVGPIGV